MSLFWVAFARQGSDYLQVESEKGSRRSGKVAERLLKGVERQLAVIMRKRNVL